MSKLVENVGKGWKQESQFILKEYKQPQKKKKEKMPAQMRYSPIGLAKI